MYGFREESNKFLSNNTIRLAFLYVLKIASRSAMLWGFIITFKRNLQSLAAISLKRFILYVSSRAYLKTKICKQWFYKLHKIWQAYILSIIRNKYFFECMSDLNNILMTSSDGKGANRGLMYHYVNFVRFLSGNIAFFYYYFVSLLENRCEGRKEIRLLLWTITSMFYVVFYNFKVLEVFLK